MRVDVQREESPIKEVQITLTGEEAKDLYRWMSTGKDASLAIHLMDDLRRAGVKVA